MAIIISAIDGNKTIKNLRPTMTLMRGSGVNSSHPVVVKTNEIVKMDKIFANLKKKAVIP